MCGAGIVTTTRVTHASPSGTFAKSADRRWEIDADIVEAGYNTTSCPDITEQLVHMHPGNKFKVAYCYIGAIKIFILLGL